MTTNAQRPTGRGAAGQDVAGQIYATRSLAASKANWTRVVRRAFPDGGPTCHAAVTLPSDALQYELTRRAWTRGEVAVRAMESSLMALRAKQTGRLREMARCAARVLGKVGAS